MDFYALLRVEYTANARPTAPSGAGTQVPPYAYYSYEKYKTEAHFRAFATTGAWRKYGVSTWTYRASTVDDAIAGAVHECQAVVLGGDYAATISDCKVHSIGNIFVYSMDDEELEKAKQLYREKRNATNADLVGFVPGDFLPKSETPPELEDIEDARLCRIALTSDKLKWESRSMLMPYVKEEFDEIRLQVPNDCRENFRENVPDPGFHAPDPSHVFP